MSQAARASTQGSEHSLMSRLRERAYKIFRATVAEEVLKLVDFGFTVLPYRDVKRPAVSRWRDLKDSEYSLQTILELWERVRGEGYEQYGVFLGRPSGHLILIDLDDVEATRARDEGRDADAERIVDDLAAKIEEVLPRMRDTDFGVEFPPVMLTRTRRGLHILLQLTKNNYEKLVERLGKENLGLGQAEFRGHQVKVELRVKGVTPLKTMHHNTKYWVLPLLPVRLNRLEKLLETLGVRLPKPPVKEEVSAAESREGNHNVQKVIKNDDTTHTPSTSNSTGSSVRETKYWRRLTEPEINKIVDVLAPYWIRDHRNNLEIALLGWMIKRKIAMEPALKVIRRIGERAADEELTSKRIPEVYRHYRLVLTGEKNVKELIGKTGILTELQQIIKKQNPGLSEEEARDKALSIISELEKVLGPRKTILVRTPYKTNTWFVNDPQRGIVLLREKRDENGEVRRSREYISDWYVKRVLVVRGEGQYNYRVLFVNARTREKLVLTGQMDEIARELRRIHGVKRSQVITDAVSAIISELIRRKVAKLRKTAAAPGIIPTKNSVKLVRIAATTQLLIPREPDLEKAKQALDLLVKLREHYDTRKFDVAINWAAYAPAGYAVKKHFHVKQVYLMLHGERHTGKSTLADIVTRLYPLPDLDAPEEGLSEYRMGYKLNLATVPVLEDEAEGFSKKPAVIALIKRAATNIIARWRGDTGRKYFARAALILVSNQREILNDPGAVERIISIEFTHNDYVGNKSREEREEFKRIYNKYRAVAPHLGAVILQVIVENWNEIAEYWPHQLQEKKDYLEFGQWLWRKVAEKLGIEPPPWATTEIELDEENPDDIIREAFWDVLHDVIAEYARLYKCKDIVLGCLARLGQKGLLPNTIIEWSPARVIVKGPILKEIERRLNVTVFGGLRGLAEKLGLEFKNSVKINGKVTKGIIIPINELIKKLGSEDDVVSYIAETLLAKYIFEGWGRSDAPVIPKVVEEARRLGIEIDYNTADKVARKLYELSKEYAEEALA